MEQAVLVGLHNDEEIIYLKGPEFSVGRGLHNSYVCRDLTISRCHCIFRIENNKWTVSDRSSNGTSLNSKPLPRNNSLPMENNDVLELSDNIKYRFCFPYNANKKRRVENNNSSLQTAANSAYKEEKVYVIPDDDDELLEGSSNKLEVSQLKNELCREKAIIKKLTDDSKEMQTKIFGLEVDLFNKISSSVKLEQEIIDLKNSCTNLQKERDELQAQLTSYESETTSLRNKLEKSQEFKVQSDNFEEEENKLLHCVLRAEINEKESNIKLKIDKSLSLLQNINDKDVNVESIQTYLAQLQTDVDELITKRNELDYNKSVHITVDDKSEKIKEDLFCLMETDLQCSICSEIFVKATSLNCGHSFCKQCIEQWRRQKNTCPVCRIPIKSSLPCIAIDNYVDQTIDLLAPSKKELRIKLKEAHEASTSRSANVREISANRSQTVYISSDSDSESEDWDTEDFSDYSDGYYGGYGVCYICGAPDHWANSCPQRRGGGGRRARRR